MGEATDTAVESLREHWRLVIISITAVFAYLLVEPMGSIRMDVSWFLWFGLSVGIFLGTLFWSDERYKTRQFVGPNFHFSVKGPIQQVGDLSIIPVGSIDADWVSYEGGQGTYIVPTETLTELAGYIRTTAYPQLTKLEQLPEKIQAHVKSRRSCGEPYRYTEVDPDPIQDALGELCENIAMKLDNEIDIVEVYKKIDDGLKEMQKKYNAEAFNKEALIKRLNANQTTTSNLLGQLTQDGGALLDFFVQWQRAANKKGLIDKLTGGGENQQGGD